MNLLVQMLLKNILLDLMKYQWNIFAFKSIFWIFSILIPSFIFKKMQIQNILLEY